MLSVTIIGHSFVRRLEEGSTRRGESLAETTGLQDIAVVRAIHAGGATFGSATSGRHRHIVERLFHHKPDVVIIDLGTNDMSTEKGSASFAVSEALRFVEMLRPMNVHVIFMGVVARTAVGCHRLPEKVFNRRARDYNARLAKAIRNIGNVTMQSVASINRNICLCRDGVHLSDVGYRRYQQALRFALQNYTRACTK